MIDKHKYWVVHGGSDSYFAAKDAKDAAELITQFNAIAIEYGMPPTSKVEIVTDSVMDITHHQDELNRRDKEGELDYFQP